MSDSEPGRVMTAYHLFERKDDLPSIPAPPLMPSNIGETERSKAPTEPPPEPLELVEGRLASLEDAIISPGGLLHALFAGLERRAVEREQLSILRHEELMRSLTIIANGQVELSDRLAKLEPEVERHEAELRLVALNGAGTGAE